MPSYQPLLERFNDKYIPEPNSGCWLWIGGSRCKDGYGGIGHKRKHKLAHRVAYELFIGPIPDHLEIDHKCRVRSCVNPAHLEAVPHSENVRRGEVGAWHLAHTRCPNGHPYSGENLRVVRGNIRVCKQCHRDGVRKHRLKKKE